MNGERSFHVRLTPIYSLMTPIDSLIDAEQAYAELSYIKSVLSGVPAVAVDLIGKGLQ